MPFKDSLKREILDYCNGHLADDSWYLNEFVFIKDELLRNRLISEFKSVRFAYKLYEGLEAEEDNLIFEVRSQILFYAALYEAIIQYILDTYYPETPEYHQLTHHTIPKPICIPLRQKQELEKLFSHDGKEIVMYYFTEKQKKDTQIRFDDKCRTAEKLGLIHSFKNEEGVTVDLVQNIIDTYSYRNCLHIAAEQRKGLTYEINLSRTAYLRMRPFIDQLKEQLKKDGKSD